MPRAKVITGGRVTIPKDVRERLGLRPGDELDFIEDRGGFRLQKRVATSPFQQHRGYLKDLAGRDPDDLVRQMRGRRLLPPPPLLSCGRDAGSAHR